MPEATTVTPDYVLLLEKENEKDNRILAEIGELVNDGLDCTSVRGARSIFMAIAGTIGMDIEEDDDDGYWEEEEEDYEDD